MQEIEPGGKQIEDPVTSRALFAEQLRRSHKPLSPSQDRRTSQSFNLSQTVERPLENLAFCERSRSTA
jgi:hypothetical protein